MHFALIKAWKADRLGNLIYRKGASNFNTAFATSATVTIVEVDELVELGDLDPSFIHTPSIYVDRVVLDKGKFPDIKLIYIDKDQSPEMKDIPHVGTKSESDEGLK